MPSTTIATNPPPPPRPPSSIIEPVQRSPVLSPRIVDQQRQQRSGSVHPSSPPPRASTPPQQPPEAKPENGSTKKSEPIDMETFQQILDLEEDSECYDFAWEMASAYLDQAKSTFEEMETAIAERDYKKLSSLGHFLKGSSATLGVTKVQNTCESIQHYGDLRDNKTGKILTPDVALSKISACLKEAKEEYKEADVWLRQWYADAKAQGRITAEDED